jgi:hypothetical protein
MDLPQLPPCTSEEPEAQRREMTWPRPQLVNVGTKMVSQAVHPSVRKYSTIGQESKQSRDKEGASDCKLGSER